MKILIVGFSESIHVARWIKLLNGRGWEICLFPSVDNGATNMQLEGVTVFHTFYGNLLGKNRNVRIKGIPVISHLAALALRMIYKKISPNYQQKKLTKLIKQLKPDIVHSMEIQQAGYLVNEVKKKWKGMFPKWILTNWGSDIYYFQNFPQHLEKIREVLTNCDYYSCECNRDISLANKYGFRGSSLPVFPNSGGFDLEKLTPFRNRIKTSKRKAIIVKGYQSWAGRAQVALHALDRCGELIRGLELIVYSIQPGSGVDTNAEALANKYGMKLIIVPLHTDHNKILRYFSRSRIAIGLGISDAISTTVLESMVMGTFPIQSNTSCANEWIKNGETGMIVPPEDPEIIERAIRTALTNDKLVDEAAKKNWKIAQEQLDSKVIRQKIANFYRDAMVGRDKKIFITGIFGSGKTSLAKKYATEKKMDLFAFDKVFDYSKNRAGQTRKILKKLPDSFIIDAIPFVGDANWDDFCEYEKQNDDVAIICCYCPTAKIWLKRLSKKKLGKVPIYYKDTKGYLKYHAKRLLRKEAVPLNTVDLYGDYRDFFLRAMPYFKKFKKVSFYDTCANEYTSIEEMQRRLYTGKESAFQEYLDKLPTGYDRYYQDIEIIGHKGYSESFKTWEIIKNQVDWKNKKVIDLGCFHGYFSFKAEDNGAKVTGLDRNEDVVKTASWINELRNGKVKFKQWEGGDKIPECDIILCLNVLHHFPDQAKVLKSMKSRKMIFEINKIDRPTVEKYLKVAKVLPSKRKNRTILLCEPKKRK